MSLTRRELLTAVFGATVAIDSCRSFSSEQTWAGEIRGGAMALGHRLRGASVENASGPVRRVGVAIVGSGAAGLSAAWRLERAGYPDFAVFELENQAGGTSTYGTDGVVPYPWAAHYVPLPTEKNPALVRLLAEVGVLETRAGQIVGVRETARVREPEERLFIDGQWHQGLFPAAGAGKHDWLELERFQRLVDGWVAWRDGRGRRAFAVPLRDASDDAAVMELDRTSAADWLERHGFVSQRLRWWVEYACRDDYGTLLEDTSAWAMMYYFAARVPAPGQSSAGFVAFPEGNGRLVRHLARVAGSRLELGKLVVDVVPSEEGVELALWDARDSGLRRVIADYVVLAVPRFIVPRVLRPWRDNPPSGIDRFSYAPWLVANLHLSGRPESEGFPFAWDNVLYDSASLGYVVATHQALRDLGPTVWTYYLPLTGEPKDARRGLAALDHASACQAIVADLAPAHPGFEKLIERIDIWRWGHAMVRPVPGLVGSQARRSAAMPFGRVHFAHTDLSGLALFEEAQDHGVRAAEAILDAVQHSASWEPI